MLKRFIAFFIDSIITAFIAFNLSLQPLSILIFCWLYWALMESSQLQATIGKLILKIQVISTDGKRISFLQGTLRFFLSYISTMLFCVGHIMLLWTKRCQNLHDKLSSTLVIDLKNM